MATLLFISKRRPQQRCLLERPYGRFFHLPSLLAARGHEVHAALVGYTGDKSEARLQGGVHWNAYDLLHQGLARSLRATVELAERVRPDWVIGCSDAWAGWLAHRVARHVQARLAVDAYDNYEAYMPWNLPLRYAWRRAIRAADLTTAAGPHLAALMDRHRRAAAAPTEVLTMAADPGFGPRPRAECRAVLGLPADAPLIGYAGGWGRRRGTHVLPAALRMVRASLPEAMLVVTGHPPPSVLRRDGVLSLGYLNDAELPVFLNAVDVSAVITARSRFGLYSYPAKLYETIACGTSVIATATPPVQWILSDHPETLVPVGDPKALAGGLLQALAGARTSYRPRPGWPEIAARLEALLER